jgi:hypothetical protein
MNNMTLSGATGICVVGVGDVAAAAIAIDAASVDVAVAAAVAAVV